VGRGSCCVLAQSYAAQLIPTTTPDEIPVTSAFQLREPVLEAAGLELLLRCSPPNRRPKATSESNRARRFALPNLHDERTESSIQAFLDGPEARRGRPTPRTLVPATGIDQQPDAAAVAGRGGGNGDVPKRPTELRTLPGRLEWNAAMTREGNRAKRYGRPVSVAIVELRHQDAKTDVTPFMRSLAGPISRVLREDVRGTDLVARVAAARFQLLMPETNEAGAERLGQRLAAGCRGYIERTGSPINVRVSVAGTGLQDSLQDALTHALKAIEAA
jgi:GGDEF domain-containing protein